MRCLPLVIVERMFRFPLTKRPRFLAQEARERPSSNELKTGILILEVRAGHMKWAHLLCPRCGDHIQLPLAGRKRWTIKVDALRRPTLAPSIWEKKACGAHFFIKKGDLLWCG